MYINILGGGPKDHFPHLLAYDKEETIWVGVDRGVYTLLSLGIKPHIAFGDFDSVTKEEYEFIKRKISNLKTFVEEKDETDMELAINWAIKQKPTKIRVFGGTGGRLDHFMANVQLLLTPVLKDVSTKLEIIDKKNILYAVGSGTHHLKKIVGKRFISFVPISPDIKNFTLVGFKYPLNDCHIPLGSTLCISNELINDIGTFSFSEGILMVIRSSD